MRTLDKIHHLKLEMQPSTKYLKLPLVFAWNSALRENFDFCFSLVLKSLGRGAGF